MRRIAFPDLGVKTDFSASQPQFRLAVAAAQSAVSQTAQITMATPAPATGQTIEKSTRSKAPKHRNPRTHNTRQLFRHHHLIVAALALLVFGTLAIRLGGDYWTKTHVTNVAKAAPAVKLPAKSIAGFNVTVPAAELQNKLQTITTQPATLTVGSNSMQIDSDTIKSWLQITANKPKTEYYIHVNQAAIPGSLTKLANKYVKAPVNQVTTTEDGVSVVAVGGRNGTSLTDPKSLDGQAKDAAKNVLGAGGMQFSTPLGTVPFQSVTPAAFDKVLISDITTKKMWAYQNGQLVNSFLVSAGAPATPTPVGEFHVYAKFTVQDMSGLNANGTKYFQPKVPWVSYFYSGSAVHGVYWHPLSWFGAINSSHGCIGLPVDQAKWVFDWAPVGTTVIVHT